MARARSVGFDEISAEDVTFINDPDNLLVAADITAKAAVAAIANKTAGKGNAGDELLGILDVVDGGFVGVQVGGFKEDVPYNTGNVPVLGGRVVVDGAGKVRAPASVGQGRGQVVSIDTEAETVILDLDK